MKDLGSGQQEISESVWQGCVSAVASLLMSLLLLLAVLALCIAILGRFHNGDTSEEVEIASPSSLNVGEPETVVADTHMEYGQISALQSTANWALIFPNQTVTIPQDFYPTVSAEILGDTGYSFDRYRWLLVARADTASSEEARIAYLRLLSAREFLVHEGIAPENIDLRIVDTEIQINSSERIPVLISRIEAEIVE